MTSSAPESAPPAGSRPDGTAPAGTAPAAVGLRERKKARTRATIRSEAIRLFSERGFAATTVEQIAEAADISPSTFFRYFSTKEAVIVTDDYDPLMFQEFRDQPLDLPPIRAFRNALKIVVGQLDEAALEQERVRHKLLQSVPELRAAMLEEFGVSIGLLAEMIGERTGKPAQDLEVRTLAGAMIGVVLSVTVAHWTVPSTEAILEVHRLVDQALELLELGLPL